MEWGFYGRHRELDALREILARNRWFFAKVSGRRRIGKTTLIQQALRMTPRPAVYIQIPDSAPAGILAAVHDAFETFEVAAPRPHTLSELADVIGALARAGQVIVLDEFQYFHRKHLHEFTSHLQRVVDALSAAPTSATGGVFVLGSIHTEMEALLADRDAPLYNRVSDSIDVDHLDVESVLEILDAHSAPTPDQLLFLWNLFEGVPKFYRDCWEQGAFALSRRDLITRMFFQSSAPLRTEAEHWFLSELRGRYDVVLKFVARHPGCTHADLVAHVKAVSPQTDEQVAGYLKVLVDRYRMISRRVPILSPRSAKKGRFYIEDNFLRSWLAGLARAVTAVNFRPIPLLAQQADIALENAEGHGFEKLVATLYEERSRKGLHGFALSERIQGYWDSADTEIDLVAIDEPDQVVRLGCCRRSAERLLNGMASAEGHFARFLQSARHLRSWRVEKAAIAPSLPAALADEIRRRGWIAEDLVTLTEGMRHPARPG